MSIIFPFSLPTTGAFSFSSHISSTEYYQLLADADVHRAHLRDILKRAKRNNTQDVIEVVKTLEDYIPILFSIQTGIDNGELSLDSEIVTTWRMPISPSQFHKMGDNQRISGSTIVYEISMTLLTYALSLMSLAEETFQASDSDDKWKQCTAHLLSAQSVLTYLNSHPAQTYTIVPIDLQSSTLSPLITTISGSLHLLILYKSLSSAKSAASTASASLMSRVSIYALEKFSTALALLPPSLRREPIENWLQDAKSYSSGLAQRFMAIDSEAKGQTGAAIALCAAGISDLKSGSMITKSKDILSKKPNLSNRSTSNASLSKTYIKSKIKQLRLELENMESSYRNQNDKVLFQQVPDMKEVKRTWPSGREVVAPKHEWKQPASVVDWRSGLYNDQPTNQTHSYGGQGHYY
ncbi:uncharacterized protein V1516DRAFT_691372 [Lipomyces oligophaga]|uniref:uncharacterized protein n=1 Tax=Lipomyces oligophaga TaxID=45792 RepID=UPI0034CFF87B